MSEIIEKIKEISSDLGETKFMEVCGTHTQAIWKFALPSLLPSMIKLISGPGCPVCVTEQEYIDKALEYLKKGYKIFTFGDMLRVPGSKSSLEKEASDSVKVVYSPLEAVEYAQQNKNEKIIFLGVGFETTAPLIAAAVKEADRYKLSNFYIFSALKLISPAIRYLLNSQEIKIDGFILPGHVAAVIGTEEFEQITQDYQIPGVVSGFESEDIIHTIYTLILMLKSKRWFFDIEYKRVVKRKGNILAREILKDVFEIEDSQWRGLGKIEKSGLKLNIKYRNFDIEEIEPLIVKEIIIDSRCRCGDVIKGIISPTDCPLFSKVCTPENPYGPCMVLSEGTCAAYYKYTDYS